MNKLHNLKDKLNSIDSTTKRAYHTANVRRAQAVEEQHVFAKMKAQLQANITKEREKDEESRKVARYIDPSNQAYARLK